MKMTFNYIRKHQDTGEVEIYRITTNVVWKYSYGERDEDGFPVALWIEFKCKLCGNIHSANVMFKGEDVVNEIADDICGEEYYCMEEVEVDYYPEDILPEITKEIGIKLKCIYDYRRRYYLFYKISDLEEEE